MAEYIDRESIYKTLSMENPFGWNNDDLAELLRQAKQLNVAPVRHGQWIWRNKWEPLEFRYECSICHSGSDLESNYCPNCGAKMDGDVD